MKRVFLTTSLLLGIPFLLGAGCSTVSSQPAQQPVQNDAPAAARGDTMMSKDDSTMMEDDTMEADDAMMPEEDDAMSRAGSYVAYDAELASAAAQQGQAVIFFHAPWCPTCAALERDLDASLGDIPAGLTLLKTDFDTSLELRKRYGVTIQHTFVQVDAQGNAISKWVGGNTLESVVARLN